MRPDEFGQLGSVKPPLTPAISNIFHALSKTMETSSHLVQSPIPMQLVMVFTILIWNSTMALNDRLFVSKEGALVPKQWRVVRYYFSEMPLSRFMLLDYFILIQREFRVVSCPLLLSSSLQQSAVAARKVILYLWWGSTFSHWEVLLGCVTFLWR